MEKKFVSLETLTTTGYFNSSRKTCMRQHHVSFVAGCGQRGVEVEAGGGVPMVIANLPKFGYHMISFPSEILPFKTSLPQPHVFTRKDIYMFPH